MFNSDRQRKAAFANMAGGSINSGVKFSRDALSPEEYAGIVASSKTAISEYIPKNTIFFFKVNESDPMVVAATARDTAKLAASDGEKNDVKIIRTEDDEIIGVAVTSNKSTGDFSIVEDTGGSQHVGNLSTSEVLNLMQDKEEHAFEIYTAFGGKDDIFDFLDKYKELSEDLGPTISKDEVIQTLVKMQNVNVRTGEPLRRLKAPKRLIVSMEDLDKAVLEQMKEGKYNVEIEEEVV